MVNTDAPVVSARDGGFEACFRNYYARVLAYALRRVRDQAAAEDAAAETFLVAWRRLDDIPADPLPWLLGIARHVVYNHLRAARRRDRLAAQIGAQPERPREAAAEESPAVGRVRRALDRLSERDREVLILTTWDGLDQQRAAAVLGCSRGTFAVRLHRARTRLARELSDLDTPTYMETK
jgi:RNA polymerase sigma-70 factor (ECF subfamily)